MSSDEASECMRNMVDAVANQSSGDDMSALQALWRPSKVTRAMMMVGFGVSISQQANGSEV